MSVKPKTNLILDILLFITLSITFVTGLLRWEVDPSEEERARGLDHGMLIDTPQAFQHLIREVHEFAGLGMVLTVCVHLMFHQKWMFSQIKSLSGGKPSKRQPVKRIAP